MALRSGGFPEDISGPTVALSYNVTGPLADISGLRDSAGHAWTGISIGRVAERDWMLMVPGTSESWRGLAGLEQFIETTGASLEQVADTDDETYMSRFNRRLYAFSRRLARDSDSARAHQLVLRTLAAQVGARTGALATYLPAEDALAISATIGYPRAIVEHIRIMPGEGIIGRAFASGRPVLGRPSAEEAQARRLRYRTDSVYGAAHRRGNASTGSRDADGSRGRSGVRRQGLSRGAILAANAALAFTRERLTENVTELTRIATVDAVTGLFNRRYFEDRLEAEVQRSRRQQQDLALLMIDIDDFKRINDTWGHLEGDRALRDVADSCAAASESSTSVPGSAARSSSSSCPARRLQVAMHVAERNRRQVEQHAAHDPLPITVSVGVGMLDADASADEWWLAADRALIAAKTCGEEPRLDWRSGDPCARCHSAYRPTGHMRRRRRR